MDTYMKIKIKAVVNVRTASYLLSNDEKIRRLQQKPQTSGRQHVVSDDDRYRFL